MKSLTLSIVLLISFSAMGQTANIHKSLANISSSLLPVSNQQCQGKNPPVSLNGLSYSKTEIKNCSHTAKVLKKSKKEQAAEMLTQCGIIASDNFTSRSIKTVFIQDCARAAKGGSDFGLEKYKGKGKSNDFNCGRHGYWQAYLACLYSPGIAKQVGDLREGLSGSLRCSIKADSKRDLFNNNVALTFGKKFLKNYDRDPKGCNSYARLVGTLMVHYNKCAVVQRDPKTKVFSVLEPL